MSTERERKEYREVANAQPDPTVRTIEQLQREVSALKELHGVRLEAMDKAIKIAHEDLVRVPTDVQKAVSALHDVLMETFKIHDEKFSGVQRQFEERDVRSDKTAELNQKALDAALLTAEKAVSKQQESFTVATTKSEASFTKQIEALGVQLTSIVKTNDDKFSDFRQSISRLDTTYAALQSRAAGHGDTWGYIVAGIVVVGIIVDVLIKLSVH
jgi:hypothetical protein